MGIAKKLDHFGATLRHNSFPHWLTGRGYNHWCLTGMVTAMCTATISTLTLTTLLQDPLVQMVMQSDNVTYEDHSELLYRVKHVLNVRSSGPERALQAAG
jgi:hypothetical protein